MTDYNKGMAEDVLRSFARSGTGQAQQNSQMFTTQSISDQVRHQGVFERPKQQYNLPVDHPDATVGDQ